MVNTKRRRREVGRRGEFGERSGGGGKSHMEKEGQCKEVPNTWQERRHCRAEDILTHIYF